MKLKNVFLGAIFVFSSTTWAANSNPQLDLGAYTIRDVTNQYPESSYFEQIQECTDNGMGTTPAGVTTPVVTPNLPDLGIPIGGTGNGSGTGLGNGFPFSNVIGPIGVVIPGDPSGGYSSGTGTIDPGGNIVIGTPGGSATGTIGMAPSVGGLFPERTGIIIDQIVNIGNYIWSIVERGKPTMRVSTFRAHGLPKGVTCWTELEEWKIPKSKVFTVEQKNKLGQSMAKFTFRISYVYGGTYNGAGQYLANVTVSPVDLKVSWGVDFASEVQIPTVFNMGKKTNPLAAMQVFVYWGIGTVGRMQQKSSLFNVMGDGRIEVARQE